MTNIQEISYPVLNYAGTLKRFIDSVINTPILWDEKSENQFLLSKLLGYHNASFSYYDGPIIQVSESQYLLQYAYCSGAFTCEHDDVPYYLFILEYDPKKHDYYSYMLENNTSMFKFNKNDEPEIIPYMSAYEMEMHQELFQYCNDMIQPDNEVRLAPFLIVK